MRTGLPGRIEQFLAYAGSAAIAMAGYGASRGGMQIIGGFWVYVGVLEYLQHFSPATGIFGKAAGLDDDEADANPGYAEARPRRRPTPVATVAPCRASGRHRSCFVVLASDAARLMTRHNLVVDGGICAGWPAGAFDDITQFRKTFQERQADNSELRMGHRSSRRKW